MSGERTDLLRCTACVHKRDTYRHTGRGPSGLTVHYTHDQCSRKAILRTGWRPRCRSHMSPSIPDAPYVEAHWISKATKP